MKIKITKKQLKSVISEEIDGISESEEYKALLKSFSDPIKKLEQRNNIPRALKNIMSTQDEPDQETPDSERLEVYLSPPYKANLKVLEKFTEAGRINISDNADKQGWYQEFGAFALDNLDVVKDSLLRGESVVLKFSWSKEVFKNVGFSGTFGQYLDSMRLRRSLWDAEQEKKKEKAPKKKPPRIVIDPHVG